MKFKHKHKNHQRSNSPHKSPLRKPSKSGIPEEQPSQIKSPIFEFQQAEIDEEKTTVATLTTREVQALQRNEVKSPIFDVPHDINSDIPERDRGHLDASDLNLGDFNSDKNRNELTFEVFVKFFSDSILIQSRDYRVLI